MSIQEHFLIINIILFDLIRDANDILEYFRIFNRHKKRDIKLPRLTPIGNIENFRDTSLQLPEGLYFPFRIKNKNGQK